MCLLDVLGGPLPPENSCEFFVKEIQPLAKDSTEWKKQKYRIPIKGKCFKRCYLKQNKKKTPGNCPISPTGQHC